MATTKTLEDIITEQASIVCEQIEAAVSFAESEEDLRIEFEKAIEVFRKEADLPELKGHYEVTIGKGRADSVYDYVFIEYKKPGRLKESNDTPGNREVIKQLQDRAKAFKSELKRDPKELFGVGTDGNYFITGRYRSGRWEISPARGRSVHVVEDFLRKLSSLGVAGKPFLADYLAGDFGAESERKLAREGIEKLYWRIREVEKKPEDYPKAKVLFDQWRILFGEVCGYDIKSPSSKIKQLGEFYGVKRDPNPAALLFAVHSYYALFMKFLAAEIATMFNPLSASFLARLHQTGYTERLREELRELEDGGIYRHLGIKNFLEGDLFSWYLDAWDDSVEKIIRQMVACLDEYDPKTLSIDPIESRDLLKKLYQQLFPKTVRHDLGEYYTPDWLAELVIERVGYAGNPDKRVLDPACGSGTFLVMAINKVREYADKHLIPKHDLLPKILNNIVGFDLNPLAVMAARTNYLLALRELLKLGGGIEIPVYLCDSIITPTEYGGLITEAGTSVEALGKVRELKTSAARFMIPTEIAKNRHTVADYAEELEHCLRNGYTEDEFLSRARGERIPLVSEELHRTLYRQIENLRKQSKNDIWARIIKNSFAPLFTERVDYVVGNPPWIGWENLPSEYRKDSASIWEKYGLIPDTPKGNWFRVAKLDLAALFVYVCLDSYLSEHGKLGFVITQSVYKNVNAGKKFRRCLLPGNVPFRVLTIDDMVSLDPFEDASNRTTTMVFQKNLEPLSDIPYTVWRKSQPGPFWSLDYKNVLNQSLRTAGRAYPENPKDISSPWVTPSGDVVDHALAKLRQPSAYRAREGTNTRGANAIFWIKILESGRDASLVENFIGRAKSVPKNIKPRTIENDFLYPLLRSSDVLRKWQTRTELGIIVPQNPQKPIEGFPESEMKRHHPKTYEYLNAFKSYLSSRKPPSDPFYTLYDVGSYTFAPWKVVWLRPAKRLDAAVVGRLSGKTIIPQETITLVALDNEKEAHYVCALINSSIGNLKAIQSGHAGTKSFGSPEVLERLSIPKFERNNDLHARLMAFSLRSHRAVAEGDDKTILQLETEIDEAAADLWGITPKELAQIQKTLKKG